jgi:Nitrile hydratase, alpha chain
MSGSIATTTAPLSDVELRVRTLESLLVDKGLVDPAALDAIIDTYETRVGPRNGARIVARAWVDPDFRSRLLADGTAAAAQHGYEGRQADDVVEPRYRVGDRGHVEGPGADGAINPRRRSTASRRPDRWRHRGRDPRTGPPPRTLGWSSADR